MTPMLVGIIFLVVGCLLTVVEIHTLTFYLLAIAFAAFVAGGVSVAGVALTPTLFTFGIAAALALPVSHWLRLKMKNRKSDEVSNDDIGNSVVVTNVDSAQRLLRVEYRGTVWDARLAPGSVDVPTAGSSCTITERLGNLLVVSSRA